ncbi:hypothetical protein SDC9_126197 [bioreactor metagenome]|uniref:Uncharacterized protein n=1 Tax=bioreactor metagenome TaxID=1076179 RepID=A0A645CQK9_9ZZZZ
MGPGTHTGAFHQFETDLRQGFDPQIVVGEKVDRGPSALFVTQRYGGQGRGQERPARITAEPHH